MIGTVEGHSHSSSGCEAKRPVPPEDTRETPLSVPASVRFSSCPVRYEDWIERSRQKLPLESDQFPWQERRMLPEQREERNRAHLSVVSHLTANRESSS